MSRHPTELASRRRFLQFLAASPLFAQEALAQGVPRSDPMAWAPRDLDKLISDPTEALDVFDFEPVAKKNLPPAHFGYLVTGIDDESGIHDHLRLACLRLCPQRRDRARHLPTRRSSGAV